MELVVLGTTFIRESIVATSVKIDEELKLRIQRLAELRDRSPHWIMREAIAEYVAREEGRESFKQEAMASWTAFQETGRHLTAIEVRSWLTTWGADNKTKPPKCHK